MSIELDDDISTVLAIADGLPHDQVRQRAYQAFTWANECRARYTSLLDVTKRSSAATRALTWANILRYLDESAAESTCSDFTRDEFLAWQHGGHWWDLLNVFAIASTIALAMRALFGTKPIIWYAEQEGDDS